MRVVVRNANLVDCVAGEIVPGSSVTVVDGRIADISQGGRSVTDAGTETIALGGSYLMPALWSVRRAWARPTPRLAAGGSDRCWRWR